MNAIRVRKRANGKPSHLTTVHWLTDDEATRCGLDVDGLLVIDELDLEDLPAVEGCGSCARASSGWAKPKSVVTDERYSYAPPAPSGRISRAGKLRQTAQSGHGSRLL